MTNIEKYILAFLIVVLLAEFIPGPVNAVLILVLVGLLLAQYQSFSELLAQIGTITLGGK